MGKMVREDKTTWKANYFTKLTALLDEYPKCFIVGADNVGSKQMQEIRIALRGQAVVLMGKNTMMRKAIRGHLEKNPDLERLMPHIKQNVGFVFTKMELLHVRDLLLSNKVKAPAKAGALAPVDVVVPAQNTGMGPVKISPFSYGLVVSKVYDSGSVFDPEILDITDADLLAKFQTGVRNVAAMSLAMNYPNVASVPHSIVNGMKNLLAIAAATEITFKEAETVKAFLADPSAFAAVAAPAAAAAAPAAAAAAAPAAKEESEEEDDDMGFGLFD